MFQRSGRVFGAMAGAVSRVSVVLAGPDASGHGGGGPALPWAVEVDPTPCQDVTGAGSSWWARLQPKAL
ncbi:MAG: hypothetical protein KDF67_07965, partial [Ottowia sp.]|nr:hypothetical protein [Ottowia sp.]